MGVVNLPPPPLLHETLNTPLTIGLRSISTPNISTLARKFIESELVEMGTKSQIGVTSQQMIGHTRVKRAISMLTRTV